MDITRNIAAFTNVFGAHNANVLFPFATIDWGTEEDRNAFINELIQLNQGQRIGGD